MTDLAKRVADAHRGRNPAMRETRKAHGRHMEER